MRFSFYTAVFFFGGGEVCFFFHAKGQFLENTFINGLTKSADIRKLKIYEKECSHFLGLSFICLINF